MRPKMAIFKEEKWLCRVPKFFRQVQLIEKLRKKCHVGDQPFYVGGDATKNHDFQTGKQRLQGTIFLFPIWPNMADFLFLKRQKMANFKSLKMIFKSKYHKMHCFLIDISSLLRAAKE